MMHSNSLLESSKTRRSDHHPIFHLCTQFRKEIKTIQGVSFLSSSMGLTYLRKMGKEHRVVDKTNALPSCEVTSS